MNIKDYFALAPKGKRKKKKSKYFNVRTEYNGRMYDSKAEANYAQRLDTLRNAVAPSERVIDWKPQVRFDISHFVVTNELTGETKKKKTTYICDFVVTYADGRVRYLDVKGWDKKNKEYRTLPEFDRKKKLFEAIYGVELELVH